MSTPPCDFYCEQILRGRAEVKVCFENDQVWLERHIGDHHVPHIPQVGNLEAVDLARVTLLLLKTVMNAVAKLAAFRKNRMETSAEERSQGVLAIILGGEIVFDQNEIVRVLLPD